MLHLDPLDLLWPVRLGVEWRNLVDGTHQELVFLLEATHPLQELAMVDHGLGDVCASEPGSQFDLPDGFGLHLLPMLLKQRPERVPGHPHPDVEKDLVRTSQVRESFLDDATQVFKCLKSRFEDGTHSTVEWKPAKVGTPGNPRAFDTAIQRLRKNGGIRWIATGVARVCSGYDAQQERGVSN